MSSEEETLAIHGLKTAKVNLLAAREDLVRADTPSSRHNFTLCLDTLWAEIKARGELPEAASPTVVQVMKESTDIANESAAFIRKLVETSVNESLPFQEGAASGETAASPQCPPAFSARLHIVHCSNSW